MKIILLLCTIYLSYDCSVKQPESNKIVLYFLNTQAEFGTHISPESFWEVGQEFGLDTVEIRGTKVISKINNHLEQLRDTSIGTIHTHVALVRFQNNSVDTFYTEPLFKYWNKSGKRYVDKDGFFKRLLSNFLVYWYDYKVPGK